MSIESTPKSEIPNDPYEVAERQLTLGLEWADIFAKTGDINQAKSAEIVLRNPSVYIRDVRPGQLPEYLRSKWADLINLSDDVVKRVATEDKAWDDQTSGIEKLQNLMFTGNIDPRYRVSISDVLRLSSELFAQSSQIEPGNTSYYIGNVQGMQSWISRFRQ